MEGKGKFCHCGSLEVGGSQDITVAFHGNCYEYFRIKHFLTVYSREGRIFLE